MMCRLPRATSTVRLSILCVAVLAVACSPSGGDPSGEGGAGGHGGAGGQPGSGGTSASGGTTSSGGSVSSGGSMASGGSVGSGGTHATGGTVSSGGSQATGGVTSRGGTTTIGSGGRASGGTTTTGGQPGSGGTARSGGATAAGGQAGRGTGGVTMPTTGGRPGTGGTGTGGTTSTGTGSTTIDCNATMPTGGTDHCGQNARGTAGGQNWELWSNTLNSNACITTFNAAAFSARWNNNGDFLGRVGLEMGNGGKTYDQYGTLKADFAYKKSGSGGGFSYIGIYGWTTNPCVEWYIVDDRYGTMPFNAYNATQKGTFNTDGADYKLFQNKTSGTGGSRCSGVSQWDQFWSIRQSARQCGTITISEHFKAWEAAGLKLGGLLEAKILIETGGGQGSIEFPVAKVTAQ